MTPETHARLSKLLPKLGALTDSHRLKTLGEIDRIFVREGITWADVTAMLMAPSIDADELLEMIARILKRDDLLQSSNAVDFLTQLQRRAAHGGDVRMSPAQTTWLFALRDKVAKAEARDAEPKESNNVIKLERSSTGTAH